MPELERHFRIAVTKRWRALELTLTTRAAAAVRFVVTVRKSGDFAHGGCLLPEAPEMNQEELARAEEALRRQGELYLLEHGRCQRLDLAGGLAALRAGRTLSTRRLPDRLAIYLQEGAYGALFCLVVDPALLELEEVAWVDLPASDASWLLDDEVRFIDRSLRAHGDFGVYGNVTAGLRALVADFDVGLGREADAYAVRVEPRDGHGHFLRFSIDRETGTIGAAAAGHSVPWRGPKE